MHCVGIDLDLHLLAIEAVGVFAGKDKEAEAMFTERDDGFGKVKTEFHVTAPARRDEDFAGRTEWCDLAICAWRNCQ